MPTAKQLTAMRYQAMGESLRRLIAVADGLSQPATHIATAGALRVQSDGAGHSATLTLELSTQPIRQAA